MTEPVRIAVAGAGVIGQAHIGRIGASSEAVLCAIVDPSPAARERADALGVPCFTDLALMLAEARPDGVVLATPNRLHVPGALACVAAGVAVLVEKPVADEVADALRLADAAEAAGVPILVGHHRRHSPLIGRARAIVASGQLGRVTAVNGLCWFRKPDGYFDVPWRREPGGGVVLINLIHVIDDLRHLCGDIVSVQALASNDARGLPVEDTAAILLRFRSGALGTLSISDCAASPWSWELTSGENKAYPHTAEACYLVAGSEGSLSVPRLELWRHGDARAWMGPITAERNVVPEEDPLTLQMAHFCAVVRREAPPLIDAREAARSLAATLAVLEAARTEALITLPPRMAPGVSSPERYMGAMCGRVIQASPPDTLSLRILESRGDRDDLHPMHRFANTPPRFNGAPSQELWVIRRNPATGERTLDLLRWGLIPGGAAEKPMPPPINAAAELLTKRPDFTAAYAKRRCIVPIDGFYEWKAVAGEKIKQPFAIAMRDGSAFGLAGLWENWQDPASGEWVRTFCIVTTRANALVRPIHNRMPAILRQEDYGRWLGEDADPRDVLAPFPADAMVAWPVSTRVNSFRNDDRALVERHPEADGTWPADGNSA